MLLTKTMFCSTHFLFSFAIQYETSFSIFSVSDRDSTAQLTISHTRKVFVTVVLYAYVRILVDVFRIKI